MSVADRAGHKSIPCHAAVSLVFPALMSKRWDYSPGQAFSRAKPGAKQPTAAKSNRNGVTGWNRIARTYYGMELPCQGRVLDKNMQISDFVVIRPCSALLNSPRAECIFKRKLNCCSGDSLQGDSGSGTSRSR